jgi:acyl carrier protein
VGLCALALTWAITKYYLSKREARRQVYGDRFRITPDEYLDQYFHSTSFPKPVVLGVMKILNDETSQDFYRISPDERFDGPLDLLLDGMDLVEVVMRLEQDFGIEVTDAEAESTKTPRQVIELVASKVIQHHR